MIVVCVTGLSWPGYLCGSGGIISCVIDLCGQAIGVRMIVVDGLACKGYAICVEDDTCRWDRPVMVIYLRGGYSRLCDRPVTARLCSYSYLFLYYSCGLTQKLTGVLSKVPFPAKIPVFSALPRVQLLTSYIQVF